MNLIWLKRLLLPFEFEDHPLYTYSYKPDEDSEWDDLGGTDDQPNGYSRIPFYKPPQWERWGDKWYKKS